MAFGLPRAARLRTGREFDAAFTARKRMAGQYFTLVLGPAATGVSRLGLAIAKKQVKRAHDRNLLKRICRESFRQVRERLPLTDLVVMARTGAGTATREALRADLQSLYARLERPAP